MDNEKRAAAIITLNGYKNYGNRLQNYALQTVLKAEGLQVDTLIFDKIASKELFVKNSTRRIKKIFCLKNNYIYYKIQEFRNKKDTWMKIKDEEREQLLRKFSKEYIHEKHVDSNASKHLSYLNQKYDCFFIGSDQVWNPDYIDDYKISFATFADSSKRIGYAISIGKERLNRKEQKRFQKNLLGFEKISIREMSGRTIIENIDGIKHKVVVDPTLLLPEKMWLKLLPKESITIKPYILIYFLTVQPNDIVNNIYNLAHEKNYDIITLSAQDRSGEYVNGPIEFLQYIKNAKLICTDSFHGTVFSIIFNRPFIVFERNDGEDGMIDRIETLLTTLHLSERKYISGSLFDFLECEFFHVEKYLEQERDKGLDFIRNSLGNII